MAFYTADWIKQLIKEDAADFQKHINVKSNDFRSYIDANIPFVLYLDINKIKSEVLNPSNKFFIDLAKAIKLSDPNILIRELTKAYVAVINGFINNTRYLHISTEQLEERLNSFELSASTGNIKGTLSTLFNRTMVLDDLSQKNTRVVLMFPSFKTIQFGPLFKKEFEKSTAFSTVMDLDTGDTQDALIKKYVNSNFSVLQNIGHIEVDVMSSESKEVVRGLVSPRLLQALVEVPTGSYSKVARRFSKETGQLNTRLVVRKLFTSKKLVLEILVKHGISIGTLESQDENLRKASKERAFDIGKNLTTRLLKDPTLIAKLVTSKSILQHVADTVINTIKGKGTAPYSSTTSIQNTSKITKTKVSLSLPKAYPTTRNVVLPESLPIANLASILRARINLQVKENMGTGNAKNVLNYRTGRFAESATIDRLTMSKQGMVTVFYNYMRYPYATFSEGGEQQYPKTRDPKLLISKSIREIGAEIVGNRLRAVLV